MFQNILQYIKEVISVLFGLSAAVLPHIPHSVRQKTAVGRPDNPLLWEGIGEWIGD